jgi:hypothetical protein
MSRGTVQLQLTRRCATSYPDAHVSSGCVRLQSTICLQQSLAQSSRPAIVAPAASGNRCCWRFSSRHGFMSGWSPRGFRFQSIAPGSTVRRRPHRSSAPAAISAAPATRTSRRDSRRLCRRAGHAPGRRRGSSSAEWTQPECGERACPPRNLLGRHGAEPRGVPRPGPRLRTGSEAHARRLVAPPFATDRGADPPPEPNAQPRTDSEPAA